MTMLEKIIAEATKARCVFEQHANSIGETFFDRFPAGACGTASDFLANWLMREGVMGIQYVCGKRDEQSHGWLEYEGYIIDITADQFKEVNERVFISTDRRFHNSFKEQSAYSGAIRPPIPGLSGHPFRFNPDSNSGINQPIFG